MNTSSTENGLVRKFDTGATRSSESGRYDPEGFLSPIVLERFCQYMNKHRQQPDGSVRDSDNWQKGIPLPTYIKGMWRHFLHLWTRHRGYVVQDPQASADLQEDLCALMFNVQGMLHEILKSQRIPYKEDSTFVKNAERLACGGWVGTIDFTEPARPGLDWLFGRDTTVGRACGVSGDTPTDAIGTDACKATTALFPNGKASND